MLLATGAACLLALAPVCLGAPTPRLLWNATASAPPGLYRLQPADTVHVGDWVAVTTPGTVRALAAARRYIPSRVPLLKRVAAGPGDTVCALGPRILIADMLVATRRRADAAGRELPWWNGCRTLRVGDIFLLNAGSPASFDGRYFGLTRLDDIVGIARPLWVS